MAELELNKEYWDNRYENNDFPWDIGNISSPIKAYIDQLKNKELKILIPGGGNGYEVAYLFSKGFKNVFLLDISKVSMANFKSMNPIFPESNMLNEDFFSHKGKYDLILEQTFFCALLPNLRPNYVLKMNELLKIGGKLVGLLFDDKLNDDKPPFGGTKDEYKALFSKQFKINTFEPCFNSIKPRMGREFFFTMEKN